MAIKPNLICITLTQYTIELHGTAPFYLREMLKEYGPQRALRSTSKNLLCEPRTNMKTYGDRSFSACDRKLWNQLPNNIRAAGSVTIFKRQLKTHLFKVVLSNNYVDINIYPLTMNVMRLWACLYGKGAISNDNIIIIIIIYYTIYTIRLACLVSLSNYRWHHSFHRMHLSNIAVGSACYGH